MQLYPSIDQKLHWLLIAHQKEGPWDPSQATTPTGLSGANIWVAEDWLCPLSSLTLFHPLCPSLSLPSLSSDSCVFQVSLLLSPLWL